MTPSAADQPDPIGASNATTDGDTISVLEERLEVRKRIVDGGGVRITKRVHEDLHDVDETLRGEELVIERTPIDRVVDTMPTTRQEGDTTIVPVVAERLVTRRELVLVEELRITRKPTATSFHRSVPLRREEIVVERLEPPVPIVEP